MATARSVNNELKRMGREERIRRGNGYYYFYGGEAHTWFSSSIMRYSIAKATVAQIIGEFQELEQDFRNKRPDDAKP